MLQNKLDSFLDFGTTQFFQINLQRADQLNDTAVLLELK